MKKYSLLAVFLLLMCNVSVCGQTGRILFVDTTFIEKTNLQRIHHSPVYYSGNPVLKADKKWELNINGDPYAAPFSGGVWYDEEEQKFKMWYSAGGGKLLGSTNDPGYLADFIAQQLNLRYQDKQDIDRKSVV